MAKPTRTFRDSVYVTPETRLRLVHHFARNPHVSWCWIGPDSREHGGFRRLADAKADAERVHGEIEWDGSGSTIIGRYGRHYTADEWLDRNHGAPVPGVMG